MEKSPGGPLKASDFVTLGFVPMSDSKVTECSLRIAELGHLPDICMERRLWLYEAEARSQPASCPYLLNPSVDNNLAESKMIKNQQCHDFICF